MNKTNQNDTKQKGTPLRCSRCGDTNFKGLFVMNEGNMNVLCVKCLGQNDTKQCTCMDHVYHNDCKGSYCMCTQPEQVASKEHQHKCKNGVYNKTDFIPCLICGKDLNEVASKECNCCCHLGSVHMDDAFHLHRDCMHCVGLKCDCYKYENQVCDICQKITGNEKDTPPPATEGEQDQSTHNRVDWRIMLKEVLGQYGVRLDLQSGKTLYAVLVNFIFNEIKQEKQDHKPTPATEGEEEWEKYSFMSGDLGIRAITREMLEKGEIGIPIKDFIHKTLQAQAEEIEKTIKSVYTNIDPEDKLSEYQKGFKDCQNQILEDLKRSKYLTKE